MIIYKCVIYPVNLFTIISFFRSEMLILSRIGHTPWFFSLGILSIFYEYTGSSDSALF